MKAQSATFRFRKLLASVSQQSPKSFAFLIKTCSLLNKVFAYVEAEFLSLQFIAVDMFSVLARDCMCQASGMGEVQGLSRTLAKQIVVSPAMPGFLAKPKPCFGCNFFTAPKGTQPATSQVCHSTCKQPPWLWKRLCVRYTIGRNFLDTWT